MTPSPHLLLLAGSGEARAVARALSGTGPRVTASLWQGTHWSGPLPVPTRTGGFGGEDGFRRFLTDAGITAVLDATHPFAARISGRTWRICRDVGLPYLQLDRPAWTPGPGDTWHQVPDIDTAVARIPAGARVFATVGRPLMPAFAKAQGVRVFLRQLAPDGPESDIKNVTYVYGEGPFSVDQERETLTRLGVDLLLAKNSGGAVSRTKLDAARVLGLPVMLLDRPAPTGAPVVSTVDEALKWVADTCL